MLVKIEFWKNVLWVLLVLFSTGVSAQTQVVRTTSSGNRQFQSIDLLRLQQEMNALFAVTDLTAADVTSLTTALNGLTWADVLAVGATANQDISFGDHDLNAVGTATINLILADSLAVTKVINGQVSSLANHTADDLVDGETNQFFTLTRSRNAITISDTGGDGSLTYDATTGAITYSGPSASEVRAHFSAGTGVSLTDGEIAIGQTVGTTDDVTFNSVTADLTGDVTGTVSSLSNHDSDDLAEGASNLYYSDARSRGAISVTDNGGDGSLSYDSSTGAITFEGPSAAEVRAHFSAGTGVTLTDGEVAIGQAVGATDDVTFNSVTADLTGDVTGTVSSLVNHTTDSLAEGAVNLYFTAEREAELMGALDSLQSLFDGFVAGLATPEVTTDSTNVSAGARMLYGHASEPLVGGIDSVGFVIAADSGFVAGDTIWSAGGGLQGAFSADVTDLVSLEGENFYKALAHNAYATVAGGVQSFILSFTCGTSTVTYDGHAYSTVAIGSQCWFAENLRTTVYADGDTIPANLSDAQWTSTTSGATTVYGEGGSTCNGDCDEVANLEAYGRLYNWYAVDDSRGLCPTGWHVPTDAEWMTLEMELGMSSSEANDLNYRGTDEGKQLKSSPQASPSWNGYDSGDPLNSGFSALPGGMRNNYNGKFYGGAASGFWWSASPSGTSYAWFRGLSSSLGVNRYDNYLQDGYSVRCVRDE